MWQPNLARTRRSRGSREHVRYRASTTQTETWGRRPRWTKYFLHNSSTRRGHPGPNPSHFAILERTTRILLSIARAGSVTWNEGLKCRSIILPKSLDALMGFSTDVQVGFESASCEIGTNVTVPLSLQQLSNLSSQLASSLHCGRKDVREVAEKLLDELQNILNR